MACPIPEGGHNNLI